MTASIAALIIVVWIQIGAAISFFGVVPLLAYGADFTVEDVHDRLTDAPSGQFGLLTLSSFVLVALVIGLVAGRERWALRDRSIATLGLITAAFVGVFLGKAQGFVIQLAMLLTAAILLEGHPLNPFLRRMNLGTMSPGATAVFTILAFLALVSFFGWSRNLRIGDEETWAFSAGLQHVMRYLSWPLINSEEIVQHQTLFAERTDPLGFLRGLLPYGWIERDDYLLSILPEPSSPIGFVGHAYWYGGIVGLTVYAFLVGLGMKALFLRSRHSLLPVLVYAQGSWALFAAQSYNHFVTLIFFPLPALAYAFLAFFLVARERRAGGAYVPRAR